MHLLGVGLWSRLKLSSPLQRTTTAIRKCIKYDPILRRSGGCGPKSGLIKLNLLSDFNLFNPDFGPPVLVVGW